MTYNLPYIKLNTNLSQLIEKVLIALIMLFAFCMPIHPDLGRKIITLVFIILIVVMDYKQLYNLFMTNKYIKIFTLFIFFSILSILWSEDQNAGAHIAIAILKYWYFPTLIIILILRKQYVWHIVFFFLLGMITNMLISYGMYFFNIHTFFGYSFSSYYLVPFHASHMEYSIFLSLSTIILFYYGIRFKIVKLKVVLLILALSMLILLFLQNGRTGQVAFIISILTLTIFYLKYNIKYCVILFLSLLTILFLSYNYSKTFHDRTNQAKNDINKLMNGKYNTSIGTRLSSYLILPEILSSGMNPLYGTGIGDDIPYTINILKKYFKDGSFKRTKGYLHQTYLTTLVSMGFIGFVLILYMFYLLIKTKIKEDNLNFIKIIALVNIICSLFLGDIYHQREILLLLAFFSSIIVISEKDNFLNNKTSN